jgi:DNA-binding GntR family transcriptional regulator
LKQSPRCGFGYGVYEAVYMAETRLLPESVAQHNEIIRALKERDIEAAMKGLDQNWRWGGKGSRGIWEMGEE